MKDAHGSAECRRLQAADGVPIQCFVWRHASAAAHHRPVVIINPATAVRCRYYFRFAQYLFDHGLDVIAFDYRGIGESRAGCLRGVDISWLDWGCLDFEAVLQYAQRSFKCQPIHVVAHSVGGVVLGLAPSNHAIGRIFTVGAQYAFWRDYAASKRLRMIARWHIVMPLLTLLLGYFPGKRLGWTEDMPQGVVRDWSLSRRRFEDTWRGRSSARHPDKRALVRQFGAVTAPILAVSVSDDEFGTISAVERLLGYFGHSPRTHLHISPSSIGTAAIGHFAFFHSRFQENLWRLPLDWLKYGRLPADCPGVIVGAAISPA